MNDLDSLPLWHRHDPETSVAAAFTTNAKAHRVLVLKALNAVWPGALNHDEINECYGWTDAKANRRLTELRKAGLVERLHEGRPTRTGCFARLYRITDEGRAAL